MKKHLIFFCMVSLALSMGVNVSARGDDAEREPDEKGVLTFSFENDIFSGTDRHYTNGARISYISPETEVTKWFDNVTEYVPFFLQDGNKRLGFAIGQSMYAPSDISINPPNPLDRPYAGWLHADFSVTSDTDERLDFIELSLGVVGQSALGEEVQSFVHSIVPDSIEPQGWDSQLRDEPAVMLSYQRKWKNMWQASTFGLGADFIPHTGFSVGNVFTHAALGGTLRFGKDLPSDYGPPIIRPSFGGSNFFEPRSTIGWYLFTGVEGRAVARNIFLDGNTFKDSPSVDKENFVADFQVGVAVTYGDTRVSYTHILKTKEFQTQNSMDSYGSLNLSLRF